MRKLENQVCYKPFFFQSPTLVGWSDGEITSMISLSGGSKEIHKPKKKHYCMYTYSNIHILCMLALSSHTCQHLGWIIYAIWLIRKISTTWGMVGLSMGGVLVQMIASLST
jgi:hypothetical protein